MGWRLGYLSFCGFILTTSSQSVDWDRFISVVFEQEDSACRGLLTGTQFPVESQGECAGSFCDFPRQACVIDDADYDSSGCKDLPASCRSVLEQRGALRGFPSSSAAASAAAPSICQDSNSRCAGWARTGECTRNPVWMRPNCKRSCNACTATAVCNDGHSNCLFWKNAGECNNNPHYMLNNCKKSCGIC